MPDRSASRVAGSRDSGPPGRLPMLGDLGARNWMMGGRGRHSEGLVENGIEVASGSLREYVNRHQLMLLKRHFGDPTMGSPKTRVKAVFWSIFRQKWGLRPSSFEG